MIEFLNRPIAGMPAYLWAVVIGGGVVLFIIIRRKSGGSSSSTLGQAGTPAPVDTSNIDPYTGVPYSIESSINPSTGLPAYYGGPGVDPTTSGQTGGGQTGGGQTGGGGGGAVSSFLDAIRLKGSNPAYAQYDATQTGVPIRASAQAGAPKVRMADFGSSITITGPAVTGANNSGQPGGSTLWYPVQGGGFVSAQDLQVQPSGLGGAAGPSSMYQSTPWWPVATDLQALRDGRN